MEKRVSTSEISGAAHFLVMTRCRVWHWDQVAEMDGVEERFLRMRRFRKGEARV